MEAIDRVPLVTRDEELGTQRGIYLVNGVAQTYFTYQDHERRPHFYGSQDTPHRLKVRILAPISNDWQLVVNPQTRLFTLFRTDGQRVTDPRVSGQVEILDAGGEAQVLQFVDQIPPIFEVREPTWQGYGCRCTRILLLIFILFILLIIISYEAYVGLRTVDFSKLRL